MKMKPDMVGVKVEGPSPVKRVKSKVKKSRSSVNNFAARQGRKA